MLLLDARPRVWVQLDNYVTRVCHCTSSPPASHAHALAWPQQREAVRGVSGASGPSAGGLFRQYCGLCLRGGAWRAEGKAAGMRGAYSTPAVHAYSHPGKVQSDEGSLLEAGGKAVQYRSPCACAAFASVGSSSSRPAGCHRPDGR